MDALNNPYTPGAGTKPPALTGRDEQLGYFELLLGRLAQGRPERSMLISGLRGVGKTVLLTTFEGMALERDWYAASSEIRHDTELRPLMARMSRRVLLTMSRVERAKDRARRALGVLKAFSVKTPEGFDLSIDVDASTGTADSGDLEEDLSDLLVELGQAAKDAGSGVVFLLDEIQFLDQRDLEALISALHRVTQRELPLALVGGGLPSVPRLAGEAKSYAERLFTFPRIGSLDHAAARDALILPAREQGIEYEEEAVESILELSEAYPYFLQEYGRHVWQIAAGPAIGADDVKRAHPNVQADLDEGFFSVRFERATATERRFMAAMAALGDGPQESGQVARRLGVDTGQTSVTRSNLIDKGLIFSPEYGLVDFTVPHFAGFMNRNFSLDSAA
jgi:AAA ATPase-like protein